MGIGLFIIVHWPSHSTSCLCFCPGATLKLPYPLSPCCFLNGKPPVPTCPPWVVPEPQEAVSLLATPSVPIQADLGTQNLWGQAKGLSDIILMSTMNLPIEQASHSPSGVRWSGERWNPRPSLPSCISHPVTCQTLGLRIISQVVGAERGWEAWPGLHQCPTSAHGLDNDLYLRGLWKEDRVLECWNIHCRVFECGVVGDCGSPPWLHSRISRGSF